MILAVYAIFLGFATDNSYKRLIMPLFDYRCLSCNNTFSELRRISEKDDKISCPQCKNESTKRLLTSFSVGSSTSTSPAQCANAATCPSAVNGFG